MGIEQQVLFTLSLLERDCDDGDTVCRVTEVSAGVVVAVAVVFAVAFACPPCAAFLTTASGIGASAIGASAYVATLYELSANEAIGTQFFSGTPIDFGERFTKSHAGIPNGPLSQFVPPGPLLRFPSSGEKGSFTNKLVFPDVDFGTFGWDRPFNPAQTDSGDGKIIGFREWRRINGGGADYLTQILWQRISCATPQECQTPVNPDPTKP